MDFRGIVLSEGFSRPTPLRLRSEDGRRLSFGKRPIRTFHQPNVSAIGQK
jgi:hypothetical protein